MKKITHLIAFLIFFNHCFTQDFSPLKILQKAENQQYKLNFRGDDVYVVDSIYCSQFDNNAQEFLPTTRSYNLEFHLETGLVLETLDQTYNKNLMQWENSFYTTRTYNDENELIEQIIESWNAADEIWEKHQRLEFFFNSSGEIEESLTQVWENNNWENSMLTEFEYDNAGNNDKLEVKNWQSGSSSWENNRVIFQAFNNNNQLTASLLQLWDGNQYINGNQSFFTYDEDVKTETLVKVWSMVEEEFVNANRELFIYDNNGNQTERIMEIWNLVDEIWMKSQKVTNEYSAEGFDILKTTQNWANEQWNNQFQETKEYDEDGNIQNFKFFLWQIDSWVHWSQCDFYGRVLIENDVKEIADSIYCKYENPMPRGGVLNCDFENLKDIEIVVFDLYGRELFRKNMDNQSSFLFNWDFQKGFYFFTIQNSSNVLLSRKLIID